MSCNCAETRRKIVNHLARGEIAKAITTTANGVKQAIKRVRPPRVVR